MLFLRLSTKSCVQLPILPLASKSCRLSLSVLGLLRQPRVGRRAEKDALKAHSLYSIHRGRSQMARGEGKILMSLGPNSWGNVNKEEIFCGSEMLTARLGIETSLEHCQAQSRLKETHIFSLNISKAKGEVNLTKVVAKPRFSSSTDYIYSVPFIALPNTYTDISSLTGKRLSPFWGKYYLLLCFYP